MVEEENNPNDDEGKGRSINVNIKGGTKEIERLQKEMKRIEKEREKETAEYEKKIAEAGGNKDEVERLKGILKELADKEFEEKRTELRKTVEESESLIGKDKLGELLDEIDDEEFTPERLEKTRIMINTFKQAFEVAQERMKKELEDAGLADTLGKRKEEDKDKKKAISKGVASMLPSLKGLDIWTREFDDPRDFVTALYTSIATEKDPIKKQKLQQARDNLWRLLVKAETKQFRQSGRFSDFPSTMILDKEAERILKEKGKI